MMKLVVGLGNPGKNYARNRHNVGFMAVDRIHARWNGGPWRQKFQSEVAEATIDGIRVMFMKPLTFMNESGRAVSEAAHFYKLDLADIVVAHDEIDLPPARFRMKTGGGTGGHNGLKSVTAHMRDGYRRLRIGVGHPGRKELVPGYVLHDFARADDEWLEPMLDAFAAEAALLARGDDAGFASRVHMRLTGPNPPGRGGHPQRGENGTTSSDTPAPARAPGGESRGSAHPFSVLSQLLRK